MKVERKKYGICRLCLQERKLCKESHIVPKFAYKELYDENRIVKIDENGVRNLFNSEYDDGLLCKECETKRLGQQLDDYASRVIYGGEDLQIQSKKINSKEGFDGICYEGIDYCRFKLFLLSVLWRASISNRPFFEEVSLGEYEEEIRAMILNSNPGEYYDFPCIMISYSEHKFRKLVSAPERIKCGSNVGYRFYINGMMYIYKITKNSDDDSIFSKLTIKRSNELVVVDGNDERLSKVLEESIIGKIDLT